MSQTEDGRDNPEVLVEPATLRLQQGLRTCRLVLRNYRVLIAEESPCESAAAPDATRKAAE